MKYDQSYCICKTILPAEQSDIIRRDSEPCWDINRTQATKAQVRRTRDESGNWKCFRPYRWHTGIAILLHTRSYFPT